MSNFDERTHGITLLYGIAGGTPATPLAGIVAIAGLPNLVFDEIENTQVDQTSLMKSFMMTMADGGSFSPTLTMEEDRLTTLYGLFDRVDRAWSILFPSGGKVSFDGPLKRIGMEAGDAKTLIRIPTEIRVSTFPVYTPPV